MRPKQRRLVNLLIRHKVLHTLTNSINRVQQVVTNRLPPCFFLWHCSCTLISHLGPGPLIPCHKKSPKIGPCQYYTALVIQMVSEKFSLFHFLSVSAPTENEKRIKETEKAKYGKELKTSCAGTKERKHIA